jgi:hypothetical protein
MVGIRLNLLSAVLLHEEMQYCYIPDISIFILSLYIYINLALFQQNLRVVPRQDTSSLLQSPQSFQVLPVFRVATCISCWH